MKLHVVAAVSAAGSVCLRGRDWEAWEMLSQFQSPADCLLESGEEQENPVLLLWFTSVCKMGMCDFPPTQACCAENSANY